MISADKVPPAITKALNTMVSCNATARYNFWSDRWSSTNFYQQTCNGSMPGILRNNPGALVYALPGAGYKERPRRVSDHVKYGTNTGPEHVFNEDVLELWKFLFSDESPWKTSVIPHLLDQSPEAVLERKGLIINEPGKINEDNFYTFLLAVRMCREHGAEFGAWLELKEIVGPLKAMLIAYCATPMENRVSKYWQFLHYSHGSLFNHFESSVWGWMRTPEPRKTLAEAGHGTAGCSGMFEIGKPTVKQLPDVFTNQQKAHHDASFFKIVHLEEILEYIDKSLEIYDDKMEKKGAKDAVTAVA